MNPLSAWVNMSQVKSSWVKLSHWHLFLLFSLSAFVNCLVEILGEPPECLSQDESSWVMLSIDRSICNMLSHWHLFFLFFVSALVNCLEEPLCEPSELLRRRLTLLPQSGVLLPEVSHLCLQLAWNRDELVKRIWVKLSKVEQSCIGKLRKDEHS